MTAIVEKRIVVNGGFVTVGCKTVKNLGWLFKHGSQVTELHFNPCNQLNLGFGYTLKAIMMNGDIYRTDFASRDVFCQVFNRNRNMRGVMVFSDWFDNQPVGELTNKRKEVCDHGVHISLACPTCHIESYSEQ